MTTDFSLLFGMLALQLDFVTRDQLVTALQSWTQEKTKPLADVLESQGVLSTLNRQLLESLVVQHLKQHHERPAESLASLVSPGADTVRRLGAVVESDIEATLSLVGSRRAVEDPPRNPTPSPGTSGRFRVLRFHAAGGLGQVSVAHDSELNRDVALKEIKPEFTGQRFAQARFLLEAEITGRLEHPGIVPVYSLGSGADGRPYYAMRFIQGETLKAAIERFHDASQTQPASESQRALELRKLLGRFVDVCQAVEYAHSRGVLHRDLKPGNIMLGNYGETLVVDWGLAKACNGRPEVSGAAAEVQLQPGSARVVEETQVGQRIGTLNYMSPEQCAGDLNALGPATDIFSLGATLYHLLTGRTLYHALSKEVLLDHVAKADFPSPRSILKTVPRALEAICLRALAANPGDRYASAQALLDDVERFLADEPVTAYREPLAARARRWARKRPGLVSATLATTAVTLLALLTGTLLLGQKNRELAEKEAVATAVKNFLLYDLLELALPEVQARAGVAVNPGLTVRELFERARPKIRSQVATQPVVAAQLQALIDRPPDSKLTVRELVQRAAQKLDQRFQNQPLVEREAREVIGLALRSMGNYTASIPHLERCRALSIQHLGPRHSGTLIAMSSLAAAFDGAGRYADSLQLCEETYQLRLAELGPDHRATLDSLIECANACLQMDQLERAIALHEQCYQTTKSRFGPADECTLRAMAGLAGAYDQAGRIPEAHALYEEVLQLSSAAKGTGHPDTIGAMFNLAESFRELGDYEQALVQGQEAVTEGQGKLGADHPQTLMAMSNLAATLSLLGRDAEAIALFEEALAIHKVKLGSEHPDTYRMMANLASVYHDANRLADALPLFETVLKRQRELLGEEHPTALAAMTNLAMVLSDAGRIPEAIDLFEAVLKVQRIKLGTQHHETLASLGGLANAYLEAGRDSEALRLHEESVQLRAAHLGADHPRTLAAMLDRAVALERTDHRAEAVVLYEQTLAKMRKKLGANHPNSLIAMRNLGMAYAKVNRAAEGTLLVEEVLQRRKDLFGSEHADTLEAMSTVAMTYARAGRHDEAIALFRDIHSGREKTIGPEDPQTLSAMYNLAIAYVKADRDDEAILILDAAQKLMRMKLPPGHSTTLQTLQNLVNAYERSGRLKESLPIYQELIELKRASRGPKHSDTVRTLFDFAKVQRQLKLWEAAEANLLSAFDATDSFPAEFQAQAQPAIAAELVKLYGEWQKPGEANRWRKELLKLTPK